MTNNNRVNWDEIPEDVEAVVTYDIAEDTFFKKIEGKLYSQLWRHHAYRESVWGGYSEILDYFGDRFHLRPSPITQPTPVIPESTQVESSEVEATTPPEFDWSSVEDDVEAVVLRGSDTLCYKVVDGVILSKFIESTRYKRTIWKHFDSIKDVWGDSFITRPPATTPSSKNVTCKVEFYEGDLPEGMIPLDSSSIQTETYTPKPPSILTILQEAQQSILKHHGVTGKVKFTVTCSE